VLTTIPVFTGCLVDARPIGLFHLIDKGVADEKILAVPLHDPYSEGINDLPDLQQHHLREVEHFFQVYKDLEGPVPRRGVSRTLPQPAPRSGGRWRHTKLTSTIDRAPAGPSSPSAHEPL
jgi:inorganic pyrophosphatase